MTQGTSSESAHHDRSHNDGPNPAISDGSRGHDLRSVFISDTRTAWELGGFRVSDNGVVGFSNTTITLFGNGGGFRGLSFDSIPSGGSIGRIPLLDSVPGLPDSDPHPNGITSVDHVVIATANCDHTTAKLADLGFEPRRSRETTMLGEPALQRFFWAESVILEMIGPVAPGPVGKESIFGLAMVSTDLDATSEFLGDLLGPVKPAVQPGRRIATLRGRDVGISVPIAVMSPH